MLKSCWLLYFEFPYICTHKVSHRCGYADTFPLVERKIAICRQSVWNTESALNAIYSICLENSNQFFPLPLLRRDFRIDALAEEKKCKPKKSSYRQINGTSTSVRVRIWFVFLVNSNVHQHFSGNVFHWDSMYVPPIHIFVRNILLEIQCVQFDFIFIMDSCNTCLYFTFICQISTCFIIFLSILFFSFLFFGWIFICCFIFILCVSMLFGHPFQCIAFCHHVFVGNFLTRTVYLFSVHCKSASMFIKALDIFYSFAIFLQFGSFFSLSTYGTEPSLFMYWKSPKAIFSCEQNKALYESVLSVGNVFWWHFP